MLTVRLHSGDYTRFNTLLLRQLEHEIRWEPFRIPSDSLIQNASLNTIQFSKITVKDHLNLANGENTRPNIGLIKLYKRCHTICHFKPSFL